MCIVVGVGDLQVSDAHLVVVVARVVAAQPIVRGYVDTCDLGVQIVLATPDFDRLLCCVQFLAWFFAVII